MRPSRLAKCAAAGVLAALACAAPASADSISFLRGGDIWAASPDGARQVQVTHNGGYSYQSQADDGTFIALHGRRLHKIAPDGRVLADFDTPVSGEKTDANSSYFAGPFTPEISPDGTKVAYEYRYVGVFNDPGCFPVGDPNCQGRRQEVGIGYSHSDRQTGWDEPGLGRQSGWVHPSWIGNDALLMSDKSVRPNLDAMIDHPGDGNQTIQGWFEDTSQWYVRDGEIARSGDKVAFVSTKPKHASDPEWGWEDDQVTVYRMTGAAPALPEPCFSYGDPDGTYKSPSWSPDGGAIAFEDSGGHAGDRILVGAVPSMAAGCAMPSEGGKVVLEGARQPDWGPAPVPSGAKPQPPAPDDTDPVEPRRKSELGLSLTGTSLSKALRKGLAVKVTAPRAGTFKARALRGSRTMATGRVKARQAGPAKLRLRFTSSARRTLRRAGKARLTLRVTFSAPGAERVTETRKIVLR